jgi:membrane fusion protein
MLNDLFRKEAVDHAHRRLDGQVLITTPISLKFVSAALIALLVSASVFLTQASYARKETVTGWVAPTGGLVRVVARQGGQVDRLSIREGDRVRVGEVIAVAGLSAEVDGTDTGTALISSLGIQEAALDAEAAAQLAQINVRGEGLAATRQSLVDDLSELEFRAGMTDERLEIAQRNFARSQDLFDRGFISESALDTAKGQLLASEQGASQTRSSMASASHRIEDLDLQLAQLEFERRSAISSIDQRRAGLRQQRTTVQSQSSSEISSPINGIVMAIPVELGQTLPPGGTIAVIGPDDAELIAELYVPSRAIGFVRQGQLVNLMYEPFPFQRFGMGSGVVSAVSQTVLGPGELVIPGLTMEEPVFRVRVTLNSDTVSAYNESYSLRPGMLLAADIVTDRRSLIEWLFDPLYASGKRL